MSQRTIDLCVFILLFLGVLLVLFRVCLGRASAEGLEEPSGSLVVYFGNVDMDQETEW